MSSKLVSSKTLALLGESIQCRSEPLLRGQNDGQYSVIKYTLLLLSQIITPLDSCVTVKNDEATGLFVTNYVV